MFSVIPILLILAVIFLANVPSGFVIGQATREVGPPSAGQTFLKEIAKSSMAKINQISHGNKAHSAIDVENITHAFESKG